MGPDVDNLVIALAVGDDAVGVLIADFLHILERSINELGFSIGYDYVINGDGYTGQRRVVVAHTFELIDELGRAPVARQAMYFGGDPLDIDLVDRAVDKANFLRDHLVEKQATDSGTHHLAIDAHHNRLMQGNAARFKGRSRLGLIGKAALDSTGFAKAHLGQVITAEHDVLRIVHNHRLAIGRFEDVVGREH